ncbi:MAG: DUF4249 domain-containing protein [Chitinophagaceae bacterium]|nr:DUF4249 domain-containing protein [Chitinophagaceae bacterium]MCW5928742.1 DUF4249 domain-containing protein [Chitinophagaceae bacterium]
MKFQVYSVLIILAGLLVSCEKVIDVDVKDAEKKYVIEAVVTDQADGHYVKISRTKNISENNSFAGISHALVTVSDGEGSSVLFEEETDGVYKPAAFAGISGKTYTLTVNIEGEVFTAVSSMPAKVLMDSIYITEDFLFGEMRKAANIVYQDPPGVRNYYRYIQSVNGVKYNRIFLSNDEFTDGNRNTNKLRTPSEDETLQIASGDTITIQALCIDKANNDYWFSFLTAGATGGSSTASPANPVTNIQGGALGYFSAHTVQVLEVVAP